ncbi:MAG: protein kinase [Anaerolineae bacterium]|nr:protein kinase [Anaerolineae bacterium]
MSELIGTRLNRYEIRERIGRGGMAAVYKAWDANLDRWVAIKVLHTYLADDEDFKERFEREAKLVASLNHPNIVQVYDFETVERDGERIYYMVMTYVEGQTLRQLMEARRARGERFSLAEIATIMRGVCAALAYAHKRGMVHRDVTPGNILFDAEGKPVLADFGIARMIAGTRITRSGTTSGTPLYMSPEQGTGAETDSRSDIYSLGVILFELLSGTAPYKGDSTVAILMKHVNDPIPNVTDYAPELPSAANLVIARALAKSPEERYQSVEAFLHDLETYLFHNNGKPPNDATEIISLAQPHSSTTRLPLQTEISPHSDTPSKSVRLPLSVLILAAVITVSFLALLLFSLPGLIATPAEPTLPLVAPPIGTRRFAPSMTRGPIEFVETFSGERSYYWQITTDDPDIYRNIERRVEVTTNNGQTTQVEVGFYRIRNTLRATALTSLFDPEGHSFGTQYVYEADLILSPQGQPESAAGIVFRYRNEDRYYVFAVNGMGQVSLWVRADGEWTELRGLDEQWTRVEAAKPAGELNRLRLVDNRRVLQGYVNDVLVIEVTVEPKWESGAIGIYLATTQSRVPNPFAEVIVRRFSAQELRRPKPTETPTVAALKS